MGRQPYIRKLRKKPASRGWQLGCACLAVSLLLDLCVTCHGDGSYTVSSRSEPLGAALLDKPISLDVSTNVMASVRAGEKIFPEVRVKGHASACLNATGQLSLVNEAGEVIEEQPFELSLGIMASNKALTPIKKGSRTFVQAKLTAMSNFPCSACGNGVVEFDEVCDDGNDIQGDGCFNCRVESGHACRNSDHAAPQSSCTQPSDCAALAVAHNYSLPDGQYTVHPFQNLSHTVSVICQNMSTPNVNASMYLPLAPSAPQVLTSNMAMHASQGSKSGHPPVVLYDRVRLVSQSGKVFIDAEDQTHTRMNADYANFGHAGACTGTSCREKLYFGSSWVCSGTSINRAHATIDLSLTELSIASTVSFTGTGWNPSGVAKISPDRRRADIASRGDCGTFGPPKVSLGGVQKHAIEVAYVPESLRSPCGSPGQACSFSSCKCLGPFSHLWMLGGSGVVRAMVGTAYPESYGTVSAVGACTPHIPFSGTQRISMTSDWRKSLTSPTDKLTMAALFRPPTSPPSAAYMGFFSLAHWTANTDLAGFLFGWHSNSSPYRFYGAVATASGMHNILSSNGCAFPSGWATVVVTYGDGALKIYVNGALCDTMSVSGSIVMPASPQTMGSEIGGFLDDNEDHYLRGDLSLVGYWAGKWDDQQIANFNNTAEAYANEWC